MMNSMLLINFANEGVKKFNKAVHTVHKNNLRRWESEKTTSCTGCTDKGIAEKAKLFGFDFLEQLFSTIADPMNVPMMVNGVDVAPKLTVKALDLPCGLVTEDLAVTATTSKLSTRIGTSLPVNPKELAKDMGTNIRHEIQKRVVDFMNKNGAHQEIVFMPYMMPIFTPTFYSPEDFTPRRGVMVRYALAVLKNGKAFAI